MSDNSLQKLTRKINSLSTLPEVYCTVSEMLENPKVSASAVAEVISRDPVLTVQLLKIVNSAFYGLPQQVSTLTHALVMLGFSTVKSVILTMGLNNMFPHSHNRNFDRSGFWVHCFATGLFAKNIARHTGYPKVEEVFIQGLLHDIGKIVLDRYAAEEFAEILELAERKDILLVEAEKKVLSFTHVEVGAVVAEKWNLPKNICSAVEHHHCPQSEDKFFMEASIVHLADILCRAQQIGNGGDNCIPVLQEQVWDKLNLERDMLSAILAESSAFADCIMFFNETEK